MSDEQELEIDAKERKLKIRGSDLLTSIIGIIVCSALTLLGYVMWDHKGLAASQNTVLIGALKEVVQEQKFTTQTTREQTCLLSLSQEKREAEFLASNGLCKRLSRER